MKKMEKELSNKIGNSSWRGTSPGDQDLNRMEVCERDKENPVYTGWGTRWVIFQHKEKWDCCCSVMASFEQFSFSEDTVGYNDQNSLNARVNC